MTDPKEIEMTDESQTPVETRDCAAEKEGPPVVGAVAMDATDTVDSPSAQKFPLTGGEGTGPDDTIERFDCGEDGSRESTAACPGSIGVEGAP
jgi:hypothetical protein